jgi:hypothetical protein
MKLTLMLYNGTRSLLILRLNYQFKKPNRFKKIILVWRFTSMTSGCAKQFTICVGLIVSFILCQGNLIFALKNSWSLDTICQVKLKLCYGNQRCEYKSLWKPNYFLLQLAAKVSYKHNVRTTILRSGSISAQSCVMLWKMLQQTNGKLRTFITFKSNFGREIYLSVLKSFEQRRCLT